MAVLMVFILSLSLSFCVCLSLFNCVCAHVCMCAHLWGSSLEGSISFETRSLTGLMLIKQTELGVQGAQGILLFLTPRWWDYRWQKIWLFKT